MHACKAASHCPAANQTTQHFCEVLKDVIYQVLEIQSAIVKQFWVSSQQ